MFSLFFNSRFSFFPIFSLVTISPCCCGCKKTMLELYKVTTQLSESAYIKTIMTKFMSIITLNKAFNNSYSIRGSDLNKTYNLENTNSQLSEK